MSAIISELELMKISSHFFWLVSCMEFQIKMIQLLLQILVMDRGNWLGKHAKTGNALCNIRPLESHSVGSSSQSHAVYLSILVRLNTKVFCRYEWIIVSIVFSGRVLLEIVGKINSRNN